MTARMTPRGERLVIRAKNWRGRDGFLIYGIGGGGFGTSIFTQTRASAERIREREYAGQEITAEDWALPDGADWQLP